MDYRVKVAIALGACAVNCVHIGKWLSKKKEQREKAAKAAKAVEECNKAKDQILDECLAELRKTKRVYRDIYGNERWEWIESDDVN